MATTSSKVLGTVTSIVGEVRATASDGTTRILQVGDKVFSDEVISTSPTGDIKIALEGGRTLECGNDSNVAMNEGLLGIGTAMATQDSSPVVPPSVAAQQEMAAPGGKPPAGPTDVAALQAAIAAGADPSQVAGATAAGGAPGAGGADSGGAHSPVVIDQGNASQVVNAGFSTEGGSIQFPTPEFNLLPIEEGQPVVSVSVQVQVDVENPEGSPNGVVVSGNAASLIEGTNGAEGKLVNFIITLDQAFDSDVQVTYSIMPGTASSPSDFFDGPLTQTVTIPAGETEIIVPVIIVQDHLVEADETFNIVLTDAVNATINPAANTAVVTIVDDDAPPVANPDTNWTQEDVLVGEQEVPTASGNVLQNQTHSGAPGGTFADAADTDFEALTVTTTGTFNGTYGALVLNSDGSYTYTLNNSNAAVQALDDGETLADSFNYSVTDGFNTPDSSTLTITIFGTNDGPIASADTNWALEDAVDASGNVLQTLPHNGAPSGSFSDLADTDVDVETLSVSAVSGSGANVGQPVVGLYGTLTLGSDGSYTYVVNDANATVNALDTGESISESFSYTASDGGANSSANLTITIFGSNDAPVAKADTNWAVEDSDVNSQATGNVLQDLVHGGAPNAGLFQDVADSDVDVETLTVTTAGTFNGTYGTLVLNSDGSYTYTVNNENLSVQALNDGETLTDSFNYTASDGTATAGATLTITIFGSSDGPTANADTNWALEDGVDASGNVLLTLAHAGAPSGDFSDIADSDTDGDALTVSAVNGSAVNVGADVAGTYGTLHLNADGTYTYVVNDAHAAVQGLDTGETLTDTFTYIASDDDSNTALANLTITIFGSNDAPVANADTNWAKEDTNTTASGNVLQNVSHPGDPSASLIFADVADTDVDVENLTVTTTGTFIGTYGTLVLNTDGSYTYTLDNSNPTVQALDTDDAPVTDSFNYTASDDTTTANSTLTISVFGTNDAPTITALTTARVSEEGLAGGIPDTSGSSDTTDTVTTSGTIAVSDVDNEPLTVTLSAPVGTFTSGSNTIVWTLSDGGHTLLGKVGTTTIVTITITDGGAYTVTLSGPIDQPLANVEDQISFNVGVTVSDGTASANGTLTVTVEDDSPVSSSDSGIVVNTLNATFSGDVGLNYGADGAGSASITSAGLPTGWTATQVDSTHITLNGPGGTASASIVLNPDGTYTFTVVDPVDPVVLTQTLQGLSTGHNADNFFDLTIVDPSNPSDPLHVHISGSGGAINSSNQGMGVDNDLVNVGETVTMNFDRVIGDITFTINKLSSGDTMTWVAYDENHNVLATGHFSPPTGTGENDTITVDINTTTLDIGTLVNGFDTIDLSSSDGDYRLLSMDVQTTTTPNDAYFTFNVTATDADGDTSTSVIAVDVDGNPAVGGTSSADTTLTGDGTLVGGLGDDSITGGSGGDSLFGSDGNDTLVGGLGNDSLYGDKGNDLLIGGHGNDILTGGSGSDIFKLTGTLTADNADTIKDFSVAPVASGGDVLNLHDVLPVGVQGSTNAGDLGAYLTVQTIGSNTVISIDADGAGTDSLPVALVTLQNVTNVSLQDLLTNNQIIT
jgi:VCBS repeat-containing protein